MFENDMQTNIANHMNFAVKLGNPMSTVTIDADRPISRVINATDANSEMAHKLSSNTYFSYTFVPTNIQQQVRESKYGHSIDCETHEVDRSAESLRTGDISKPLLSDACLVKEPINSQQARGSLKRVNRLFKRCVGRRHSASA
ncbi:hypothetical protein SARC_05132 [Sphaeroforma arctica JP610]|uniref:Uncharacterized protein n=1 Tax=Sphaeroforma arctica JP610 TaxID=667725 RepID=A0A0L0G1B5_9EUKA|nr:hypothetical protein SARC_05132 [Sphaeroforma arctica JP610]KNC82581.1 hypothetical protein SARC_05132 [Sphaeroforma arctica JP610]|eukprot:XP_014156483.1 hypothetical protein SARC_05132 [Sphaeroforma arctica JP610]